MQPEILHVLRRQDSRITFENIAKPANDAFLRISAKLNIPLNPEFGEEQTNIMKTRIEVSMF